MGIVAGYLMWLCFFFVSLNRCEIVEKITSVFNGTAAYRHFVIFVRWLLCIYCCGIHYSWIKLCFHPILSQFKGIFSWKFKQHTVRYSIKFRRFGSFCYYFVIRMSLLSCCTAAVVFIYRYFSYTHRHTPINRSASTPHNRRTACTQYNWQRL